MKTAPLLALCAALLMSGCASVNMASSGETAKAKEFNPPSEGHAGVYLYRKGILGAALKKDLWIDGKCIGETAKDVFFYTEVEGDKKHLVETQSEFSPNGLELMFDSGKNYFIHQYIKMGLFIGGANVEQVSEEQGRQDIAPLGMAVPGNCSGPR